VYENQVYRKRINHYLFPYPLKNIKAAQEDFLRKKYSGKLVLIPTNDNI